MTDNPAAISDSSTLASAMSAVKDSTASLNDSLKAIISQNAKQSAQGIAPVGSGNAVGQDGSSAAGGGAGVNVVIQNNASVSVTAQQQTGAFDQKYLEITNDQLVASSLSSGKQTTGVLRSLFGLVPSLIGR